MPKNKLFILGLLLLMIFSACASKEINVTEAWARPGSAGANSAVYFIIHNPASEEDVLLSAQADLARVVELHTSTMDSSGVMSMQHLPNVPVPAGSNLKFEPGGLHVMLIELNQELKPGNQFTLNLTFQNAGEVQANVEVKEPAEE